MTDNQTAASARRAKLTKRVVDPLRYDGRTWTKCIVWDTDLRGFGVRVFPSGTKRWVLSYRNAHGRSRLYTLGGPELTADQARKLALVKRGAITAEGDDPVATRAAERGVLLFGPLADRFVNEWAKLHKRSWKTDEQRVRDYLAPWAKRPAVEITRADVADVHRRVGKNSIYTANRVVMLVSKIFSWAEALDDGTLPAGHPNPARRFKKFDENQRDRFLTPAEVKTLFEAIDTDEKSTIYLRAFFRLAFLLGTRKRELLTAKWEYLDEAHGLLRLPASATKGKRPLVLPLPAPARAILEGLSREAGNPHIFPGAKPGQPLVNVEDAWNRAREAAKLSDVHFHDVRRTVGSWIAQRTGNLELVAKVLNHRDPRTTKIYARFLPSQVRDALEDHSAAMIAATTPRESVQ